MEKSKLLTFGVIGLFILNLGILSFLWFRPGPPHPPHGPGGGPGEFIKHELGFNAEQISAFEKLRDDHHSRMVIFQNNNRDLHDQYFSLLKTDTTDFAKMTALADSISANQKKMDIITFDHFKQVRNLCTSEQKIKFDHIIEEVIRRMSPPPAPPPSGP